MFLSSKVTPKIDPFVGIYSIPNSKSDAVIGPPWVKTRWFPVERLLKYASILDLTSGHDSPPKPGA